jgi:hypothetical protein
MRHGLLRERIDMLRTAGQQIGQAEIGGDRNRKALPEAT